MSLPPNKLLKDLMIDDLIFIFRVLGNKQEALEITDSHVTSVGELGRSLGYCCE